MAVIISYLPMVSCMFLHMTIIFALVQQGVAYTPIDNYLISCGSSSSKATDADGREWMGDESSTFLAGNLDTVAASTTTQSPFLPSPVPFLGARIFKSAGSYRIPVTPGRHWLRMYFYPFAYEQYDPNLAIVTVNVDDYALISNMSITRELSSLNYVYIRKEFSINVTSTSLEISIIPGKAIGAYAMVNGIELISMPDIVFEDNIYSVDFQLEIPISMSITALETMYRLNVGGEAVSAANDELSRPWETDIEYIPTAATGVASPTANSIQYANGNNYTAPPTVYQTARTMTNFDSVNLNFNLTWSLPVDPGFTYYVRLHFCEFFYNKTNMRVFDIFINSELAQASFDVVAQASFLLGSVGTGEYKAVVKDYVASIASLSAWNTSVIVVALHPTNATAPTKFDSILNGLEIFKLNDSSANLQGSPRPLIEVPTGTGTGTGTGNGTERQSSPSQTGSKSPIIGGVAGAAAALALLLVGGCVCMHMCKKRKEKKPRSQTWLPLGTTQSLISKGSFSSPKSTEGSYASSVRPNLSRHFMFEEITAMTNNFDEARILGVGGFGKVYEGELEDGIKVAVKRGNHSSGQGVTEFQTEIELLSKLRHRHLVSLIGYCEEHNEMILVYDCMANGPLRGHLYGTDLPQLSWKQRLEICVGAARGLHYLHTGSAQGIIHRDVKTTNILLDEKLIAKVSDFGLSKTGPSLDHTHVSTAVKGSFGYLDPEYFRRQHLTEKSDVYSFGVVLMEVLCARPVIDPSLPRDQVNLAEWTMKWQKQGMLDHIMDPFLVGRASRESLNKFAATAERCLQDYGSDRPTMGDVLWSLEYALQLHESSEEKAVDMSKPRIVGLPIRAVGMSDMDDSSEVKVKRSDESNSPLRTQTLASEDSAVTSVSAVFSQLINPEGR